MENKNEMMVFNNEMFGDLRVVRIDNKEYFVGIDIAKALGYSNASKAVSTHCKHTIKEMIDVSSQNGNSHSKSRNTQEMTLITEGDIYRLIIRSHKPEAEIFESWVFDEILPQIRQTGGYIPIKEEDDELTIMSKAFMIAQKTIDDKQQRIEQQQKTIEQQQEIIDEQQEVIESQRDKVDFADTVSANEDDSIDMGTMAKLLAEKGLTIDGKKIGRNTLFEFLRDSKILMDDNLPYQTFINRGYFIVVEYTMWKNNKPKLCRQTLVTGKGQLYITKKVKEYYENNNKENK